MDLRDSSRFTSLLDHPFKTPNSRVIGHCVVLSSCRSSRSGCRFLFRCPCDECNISHMITCGLISPEVSEELAATHQCRYQQRKQHEQLLSTMPSKSETTGGGSQPSPSPLPPPLSFSYDPMRFLGNVKPPSMPSSGSTSRSESPLLMDHYRFMLPFGDNFE